MEWVVNCKLSLHIAWAAPGGTGFSKLNSRAIQTIVSLNSHTHVHHHHTGIALFTGIFDTNQRSP